MSTLREMRESARLSQAELAARVGTSQPQIQRLEKGDRQLTMRWAKRIAPHLGVSPRDLLFDEDEPARAAVPVVGYVGAGAAAHYLPAGELGRVDAPAGSSPNTVAVEIRGESLGSFFDRWLVFYDDVRSPLTPDLIGQLCVVGLQDGRILIKKPKKSRSKGLYHLLSQTEEPILDVAIEWAAKVKNLVPR